MTRQLQSHSEQLLPRRKQRLFVRPGLLTGGRCLSLRRGCMQASSGQLICELRRDAALVFLRRPQLRGTALGKARESALQLRLPLGGRLLPPRPDQMPLDLRGAARRTVGRRLASRPLPQRIHLGCAPAAPLAAQATVAVSLLAKNNPFQIAGTLLSSGCAGALHGSLLPLQGGCALEAGRLPHCVPKSTVHDVDALLELDPWCLSRKPHMMSSGWTDKCEDAKQSGARLDACLVTHHVARTLVPDEAAH